MELRWDLINERVALTHVHRRIDSSTMKWAPKLSAVNQQLTVAEWNKVQELLNLDFHAGADGYWI